MVQRMMGGSMTNKPREFWISMCTFNDGYTEIYETRTAEFEPCPPAEKIHAIEAGPVLEKIKRLEDGLRMAIDELKIYSQARRDTSNGDFAQWNFVEIKHESDYEFYPNHVDKETISELESILEGR